MDIEAYIASGTLEDYILGSASEQQRREVECLSSIYPEIRTALTTLEADMEGFARVYAKKPPTDFRSKVLHEVRKHEQDKPLKIVADTDTPKPEAAQPANEKVISINEARTASVWPKVWAAAAVIAIVFAAWQFVQLQNTQESLASTQVALNEVQERLQGNQAQMQDLNRNLAEAYNPDMKKVLLASVSEDVELNISLFWNPESGNIKLDASQLPALPDDKQYQLWVLKDGQPIDMGVLPKDASALMAASGSTTVGDAFAITIEPLGGQASPSLDQLVVLGNIG